MAKILGGFLVLAALTVLAPVLAMARDLDKLYEKARFKLGDQFIELYVADDDDRRERGLMYIEKMPENTGMLFVFESERPLGFWMKNTLIPLAIGFLDRTGKLIDIQEMKVASSILSLEVPTYESRGDAQMAIEMNSGWYSRHKIKVGAHLELATSVKSSLLKSLLGKGAKGSSR